MKIIVMMKAPNEAIYLPCQIMKYRHFTSQHTNRCESYLVLLMLSPPQPPLPSPSFVIIAIVSSPVVCAISHVYFAFFTCSIFFFLRSHSLSLSQFLYIPLNALLLPFYHKLSKDDFLWITNIHHWKKQASTFI